MRSKRGQFYLIAAILIVILVAASITIFNYSRKKSSSTLYDLGEELGIESQNIIDYGTTPLIEDMTTIWVNFIENYAAYAGDGKKLYFIFGNDLGMQKIECDGTSCGNPETISSFGGQVVIEVDSVIYDFDLESGHQFYFIVSQEIEGEKHVITG